MLLDGPWLGFGPCQRGKDGEVEVTVTGRAERHVVTILFGMLPAVAKTQTVRAAEEC